MKEEWCVRKQASMQGRIQAKPQLLIGEDSNGRTTADKVFLWNSLVHLMPNLLCRIKQLKNNFQNQNNGEFETYGTDVLSTQNVV